MVFFIYILPTRVCHIHIILPHVKYDMDPDRDFLLCAPTGKAAKHINGRTLHDVFKLPCNGFRDGRLTGKSLEDLQADVRTKKLLIIDEKSMMGAKMMKWVHTRCTEAFGTRTNVPFGGLSVILVGDWGQPVCMSVCVHWQSFGSVYMLR